MPHCKQLSKVISTSIISMRSYNTRIKIPNHIFPVARRVDPSVNNNLVLAYRWYLSKFTDRIILTVGDIFGSWTFPEGETMVSIVESLVPEGHLTWTHILGMLESYNGKNGEGMVYIPGLCIRGSHLRSGRPFFLRNWLVRRRHYFPRSSLQYYSAISSSCFWSLSKVIRLSFLWYIYLLFWALL